MPMKERQMCMQNLAPISTVFCDGIGLWAQAYWVGGEERCTRDGRDRLLDAGVAHVSLPSCPQLQACWRGQFSVLCFPFAFKSLARRWHGQVALTFSSFPFGLSRGGLAAPIGCLSKQLLCPSL